MYQIVIGEYAGSYVQLVAVSSKNGNATCTVFIKGRCVVLPADYIREI